MVIEREQDLFVGRLFLQYSSEEVKVAFVGSQTRKRDTFRFGLQNMQFALTEVEKTNGSLPAVTVGYTNRRMADFVRRRFGFNTEMVRKPGSVGYYYKVWGDTRSLREKLDGIISQSGKVLTQKGAPGR